jgi:hypothetical protein
VAASIGIAAVAWALIGFLPAWMVAATYTSKLEVLQADVPSDTNGVLDLHLHLDSAMAPQWPIYFMLDGAKPVYGFSGLVDFSSGPDQVAHITLWESLASGRHTLSWGYAVKRSGASDWTASDGGSVEFQVSGSSGGLGPSPAKATEAALLGDLIVAADLLLLVYFFYRLYRVRREGRVIDIDDSILLPEPPPQLTPAMAVVLRTGRIGTDAYGAALADIAGRGITATWAGGADDQTAPERPSVAGGRLGEAEAELLATEQAESPAEPAATSGAVDSPVSRFYVALARDAAKTPWFRSTPVRGLDGWTMLGLMMAVGLVLYLVTSEPNVTIDDTLHRSFDVTGFVGVIIAVCARFWYCNRTAEGARVLGMAMAYRNTLRYELITASNADQGMESITRRASWLKRPEELRPWILALGLKAEMSDLLARSKDHDPPSRTTNVLGQLDSFPASTWQRMTSASQSRRRYLGF